MRIAQKVIKQSYVVFQLIQICTLLGDIKQLPVLRRLSNEPQVFRKILFLLQSN